MDTSNVADEEKLADWSENVVTVVIVDLETPAEEVPQKPKHAMHWNVYYW